MRIYNEHYYRDFDELVKKIETSSSILKISSNFGFSDKEVQSRLIQQIVNHTFVHYFHIYKNFAKSDYSITKDSNSLLKMSGITFNKKDNSIKISSRLFFFSIVKCLGVYSLQFYELIKTMFLKKRHILDSYSIMLDHGTIDFNNDISVNSFLSFCESGEVSILKSKYKIIKSNYKIKNVYKNFSTSTNPIIYALNDARICRYDLFTLLIKSTFNFIKILIQSCRFPLFSIVSYDFVKIPIVFYLNQKNLLNNFVFTTSSMHLQPIWTRPFIEKTFSSHFINYSNNNVKFQYKDNPFNYHYPILRHIRVDEQWVWNRDQGIMYLNLGHRGKINITGPILFYLPNFAKSDLKSSKVRIAIFDITPVLPNIIETMACMHYYYTTETVTSFLEHILEVVDQISNEIDYEIEIILKNKRSFKDKFHDPAYLINIDNLQNKYKNFITTNFNDNLFSLINDSDLTITIPYSSVSFVSAFLNKPAIFYDSTGSLLLPISDEQEIMYINRKDELYTSLKNIIIK